MNKEMFHENRKMSSTFADVVVVSHVRLNHQS